MTQCSPDSAEPALKHIQMWVCQACLDGVGEMCHTPGCAFIRHKVDLPIIPELYTVVADAPAQAASATDEMERIRDLLHEARQYVSDAGLGCEDDNEVKIHSEALLALIDQALATPLSRPVRP